MISKQKRQMPFVIVYKRVSEGDGVVDFMGILW